MEITHRVSPFMDWMRVEIVEPQQGITALTSANLVNYMLEKRKGISTRLVPLTTPPQPPRQGVLVHQLFQLPAPAPPPAPAKQVAMPEERWGADLRILLRLCNASTAAHLPDI